MRKFTGGVARRRRRPARAAYRLFLALFLARLGVFLAVFVLFLPRLLRRLFLLIFLFLAAKNGSITLGEFFGFRQTDPDDTHDEHLSQTQAFNKLPQNEPFRTRADGAEFLPHQCKGMRRRCHE
jgi:hypothetical protein